MVRQAASAGARGTAEVAKEVARTAADAEAAAPQVDEEAARAGAEKADTLRKRFDKWFYVISDSSFKQIHKDRTELFKASAAG